MAIVDTFGKCKCGEFNALSAVTCHSCGSRLPWAYSSANARTATGGAGQGTGTQANYWSAALSGQSGATASASSYNNDPDIDFTAPAGVSLGSKSAMGIDFFCSHCGMGLSAKQHICHRCHHLTTFTKADLKFTLLISSLLVSGFLLGVVWTAVVLNAAHTGEFRLPDVQYTKSQTGTVKKPIPKPTPPKTYPVDEYGTARR